MEFLAFVDFCRLHLQFLALLMDHHDSVREALKRITNEWDLLKIMSTYLSHLFYMLQARNIRAESETRYSFLVLVLVCFHFSFPVVVSVL